MAEWTPPEGHGGRWILACIAGLAIGAPLAAAWTLVAPGGDGPAGPLIHALAGAIAGGALGTAQALVLRRAYPGLPIPAWILASVVAGYIVALGTGLVFGMLVAHAGSLPLPAFVLLGATVKGVLAGLCYGFAQGRVLGSVTADRAGWQRVVMIGWLLGTTIGSMRWLLLGSAGDPASLMLGAIAGGAVEGAALGLVSAGAFRFMPPRAS